MKRIQKGPVRGISLRLQEEVSALINFARRLSSCLPMIVLIIIGTRAQDGLHPRTLRDPDRGYQGQQRPRPQGYDQGPQLAPSDSRPQQEGRQHEAQTKLKPKVSAVIEFLAKY